MNQTLKGFGSYLLIPLTLLLVPLFSALILFPSSESHDTVYLESPENQTYTNLDNNSLQFIYNHTGNLTGVVNCTLYIDGTPVNYQTNVSANQSTTVYSNSTISEGQHWWWVVCENGTANESSVDAGYNYTFTSDYTNPTKPTLISPPDGTNSTDSTPDLNWTTVTETNFANYTIQVDDDPGFGSVDYTYNTYSITESNYSVTSGWTDAKWYWRVIAYDKAGNSNTSDYFTYTVDTTAPTITLNSPSNTSVIKSGTWINLTITDLTSIQAWWSDDGGVTNNTLNPPYDINTTGWSEGLKTIDVWANDSLSHLAHKTYQFTIDDTKPTITIHLPANASYTNDTTPLLNATSSDNNSNLMWYSLDSGANETNGCNATSCLVNLTKNWVVGSGGDSWSGNVTYQNTTEVQATGKIELRQLVDDYVSYWRFDEGSGTTANDENTTNANDGTINGATWTNGKFGKALSFDGENDYVDCGNDSSLDITDAITIEAWVKADENLGRDILNKEYYIYALRQNKFYLTVNGSTISLDYTGQWDGNWHHIVATFDGTTRKVFIDGSEDVSNSDYSGTIDTTTKNLKIGYKPADWTYFLGLIDEVRIYNRALTPEEINQTMNNEHHTSGNLTSIVKDAESVSGSGSVWKQIKFDGTVPSGTNVSIYVNMSADNSTWSGWILVKENATPGIFYELPENQQKRYGSWRLVLQTGNTSLTPEISSVTFGASLIDGTHNVTVYANDSAGNLNSTISYFTVDTTPPTITWNTPADNNSTIVFGLLIHNITFEDENLYMVNCTIYNDSAMTNPMWSVQYNLTGNTTWTLTEEVNVSNWTDGIYYENCTITDME